SKAGISSISWCSRWTARKARRHARPRSRWRWNDRAGACRSRRTRSSGCPSWLFGSRVGRRGGVSRRLIGRPRRRGLARRRTRRRLRGVTGVFGEVHRLGIIDVGGHVGGIAGNRVDRRHVVGDDILGAEVLVDVLGVVRLVVVAAGRERQRGCGDDDQGSHGRGLRQSREPKKEAAGITGSLFKCQRLLKPRRRCNYIALFVATLAAAFAASAALFASSAAFMAMLASVAFMSTAFMSVAFMSVARFSSTFMVLLASLLLLQAATARAAPATRIRARIQDSLIIAICRGHPRRKSRGQ